MMTDAIDILTKIFVSVFLSGLIGVEREFRLQHKGAGLRTHILVGVGSSLIVLTSFYVFDIFNDITVVDPTRMITGIVTGVGFLCAGTIIRGGSSVTGLTTAASLWIVSGIGMAAGAGHYLAAFIVTITVLFVLTSLRTIERKIGKHFQE